MPIRLNANADWQTGARDKCKYSPVIVDDKQDLGELKALLETRKGALRKTISGIKGHSSPVSFTFLRSDQIRESRFKSTSVPIFVISGGSSRKIYEIFRKSDGRFLAWDPSRVRGEPVYLFVHRLDYQSYAENLSHLFAYRNFMLVGWDGSTLTGFGATRAAVLAYADQLPYSPKRLIMTDQDVLETEETRHTRPDVKAEIEALHTAKPIVGYGVGYPDRTQKVPSMKEAYVDKEKPGLKPSSNIATPISEKPTQKDLNSPTQQFVSIAAPFLPKQVNNLYPYYMVAGGEDMVMSINTSVYKKELDVKTNISVRQEKISKTTLPNPQGPAPSQEIVAREGKFWSENRVQTLRDLFKAESEIPVEFNGAPFNGKPCSLGALSSELVRLYVATKSEAAAEVETVGVSALIVERAIIHLMKLAPETT